MVMNMTFLDEHAKIVKTALDELLAHRIFKFVKAEIPLEISICEKGLRVEFDGNKGKITFNKPAEFFRALVLFDELYSKGEKPFMLEQTPAFDMLSVMLDNSRNAVQTVGTVKQMIRHMAVMGYNALLLYTEDTYEIEGHPYFGYMRGRLTADEIGEIDSYAADFGVELIPCIQTLAHLNAIFRWPDYGGINDINDILLVGDEKTYELIDSMIGSLSRMFRSRRINVGMDEAWMLGHGKYLSQNGHKPKPELMAIHLGRVMEICQRYGMHPMMWSDMFFRTGNPEFAEVDGRLSDSAKAKIPEDVTLVHWDYVSENKEALDDMLRVHKLSDRNVLFAGGAWKWSGVTPFLDYSMRVSRIAVDSCRDNDIKEVMVTAWSDGGGEASNYTILPVLQLYAEGCYVGDTSDEYVAERLMACIGALLSDFMLLDLPNQLPGHGGRSGYEINPAVYLLYADPLMGLFDRHVNSAEFRLHYKQSKAMLSSAAKEAGSYGYIFKTLSALCDLLADKADIGLRLRSAYLSEDRGTLEGIAGNDLCDILEKVQVYYDCLFEQWHMENKPHGFDVQDLRLGGLMQRIKAAKRTVERYVSGEADSIPELEEGRLYYDGRNEAGECIHTHIWRWSEAVTANVL